MTETVVASPTREVRIGFDRPFVIIGERINPTGRKVLAEEIARGDYSRVEADALAQVEAGAHMLDVNAGVPLADEAAPYLTEALESRTLRALEMGMLPVVLKSLMFLNGITSFVMSE